MIAREDFFRPIPGGKARLYTPEYHREIAALHADGPCGCESCGLVSDEKNAQVGQLGLFGAA